MKDDFNVNTKDVKAYLAYLNYVIKKFEDTAYFFNLIENFEMEAHALAVIHHTKPLLKLSAEGYKELVIQEKKKKKKPKAKTALAQVIKLPVPFSKKKNK